MSTRPIRAIGEYTDEHETKEVDAVVDIPTILSNDDHRAAAGTTRVEESGNILREVDFDLTSRSPTIDEGSGGRGGTRQNSQCEGSEPHNDTQGSDSRKSSSHMRPKLHRLLYKSNCRDQKGQEQIGKRIQQGKGVPRNISHMESPVYETEFMDECGRLPIHIACQDDTRASFDVVKKLVEKNHEAVTVESRFSRDLALHMACNPKCRRLGPGTRSGRDNNLIEIAITQDSELERIIVLLMTTYPEGVLFNNAGSTALHSILEHRPSLFLVKCMIDVAEKKRKEIVSRQSYEELKFDVFISIFERKDGEEQLPLHVAIERHASPEASSMLGSRGYTALHSAIQRGCTRTVFKRLLVHNKNALFLENKKNALSRTPLHLLFTSDENIERWSVSTETNSNSYSDRSVSYIHGPPEDLLSPTEMVHMALYSYYSILRNTNTKIKKRMRKRTHKEVMRMVRSLLKTNRDTDNMSVIELARSCKEMFQESFPDCLLKYLEDVVHNCVDIKEREEDNIFERNNYGGNSCDGRANLRGGVECHAQREDTNLGLFILQENTESNSQVVGSVSLPSQVSKCSRSVREVVIDMAGGPNTEEAKKGPRSDLRYHLNRDHDGKQSRNPHEIGSPAKRDPSVFHNNRDGNEDPTPRQMIAAVEEKGQNVSGPKRKFNVLEEFARLRKKREYDSSDDDQPSSQFTHSSLS